MQRLRRGLLSGLDGTVAFDDTVGAEFGVRAMSRNVSACYLTRVAIALALGVALLVSAPRPGSSRSLDPSSCASSEERVAFLNLIFCWPTGKEAPEFSFEMPETMQGTQNIKGETTIFTIFPVNSAMFRAFSEEIAGKEQIAEAIQARAADGDIVVVDSYEGKYLGWHPFEFRKAESKLFVAAQVLSVEGWPPERIEYWVAMTDDGKVDYVMRCRSLGERTSCSGQFLLFDNLVRIGILSGKDTSNMRAAFETLQNRIRSYVVSPSAQP